MPFDWKANGVRLSFGHLEMKKHHALHLGKHGAEAGFRSSSVNPNKAEDLGVYFGGARVGKGVGCPQKEKEREKKKKRKKEKGTPSPQVSCHKWVLKLHP